MGTSAPASCDGNEKNACWGGLKGGRKKRNKMKGGSENTDLRMKNHKNMFLTTDSYGIIKHRGR
jgi:hypothetical protein